MKQVYEFIFRINGLLAITFAKYRFQITYRKNGPYYIEKKGRFHPSDTSAQDLSLASAPYTILMMTLISL